MTTENNDGPASPPEGWQAEVRRCPGRDHRKHVDDVCDGSCCTACGGPIDEDSNCRCDNARREGSK